MSLGKLGPEKTTANGLGEHIRAQMIALGPGDASDAFQVILVELLAEIFERIAALEPKDEPWQCRVCGNPCPFPRLTCSNACYQKGAERLHRGEGFATRSMLKEKRGKR